MIVEFTGCSGAGKTALSRMVGQLLRERNTPAMDAWRLVLGSRLRRWLPPTRPHSTHVENVTVELLGWPWTIGARRLHRESDRQVRTWIREVSLSRAEWCRLSRSWNRKLAVLAGFHRYPSPRPMLLQDEGTVHFAMTLLARQPNHSAPLMTQYLDAVPFPMSIVCVDAPRALRLARLARRGTRPAPDRDGAARDRFFERADDVMEDLCQHPRVAPRLVRVSNDHDDPHALRQAACHIVERVAAWHSIPALTH